ncbi:MAG TPA: hypothetical protein VGK23_06410 [Methanomassiliicoccales archaeon]|jgi:hypothetical protein
MDTEIILEIILIWLIIGVVIGGWISIDTFRRKVEGARWVAAGVFLSVIGLVLYLYMRKRADGTKSPEFRASPEYKVPSTPSAEPVQSSETPKQEVAEEAKTEERSQYSSWPSVIKEQIEGAPRCPKCGVAASGFDVFCAECGAKIK